MSSRTRPPDHSRQAAYRCTAKASPIVRRTLRRQVFCRRHPQGPMGPADRRCCCRRSSNSCEPGQLKSTRTVRATSTEGTSWRLPPLLIQVGENEIVYDDATRIRDSASAAGVEVTFESWRYGFHVWPVYVSAGLPDSAIAIEHLA